MSLRSLIKPDATAIFEPEDLCGPRWAERVHPLKASLVDHGNHGDDGTQCGRVTDGSNLHICHIHAWRHVSPIIPRGGGPATRVFNQPRPPPGCMLSADLATPNRNCR